MEDAWELIAVAFHWPPSAMDGMGLTELLDWEARARAWLKAQGLLR